MSSNFMNLRSILEKDKLDGTNFPEWFRNLRIVLKIEGKLYVLETPIPNPPPLTASRADQDTYQKYIDDSDEVTWLMLAAMKPRLQKQLGFTNAYDMIKVLKEMFQKQARIQRYKVTKLLIMSKMAPGSSVGTHVLKIRNYIDQLEKFGSSVPKELAVDLILGSLSPSFDWFIKYYHKRRRDKSITELQEMLKDAEEDMETKVVIDALWMQRERESKGTAKNKSEIKGKDKVLPKPGIKKPKGEICFFQNKRDHWKKNCKLCQKRVKTRKSSMTTTSGIL